MLVTDAKTTAKNIMNNIIDEVQYIAEEYGVPLEKLKQNALELFIEDPIFEDIPKQIEEYELEDACMVAVEDAAKALESEQEEEEIAEQEEETGQQLIPTQTNDQGLLSTGEPTEPREASDIQKIALGAVGWMAAREVKKGITKAATIGATAAIEQSVTASLFIATLEQAPRTQALLSLASKGSAVVPWLVALGVGYVANEIGLTDLIGDTIKLVAEKIDNVDYGEMNYTKISKGVLKEIGLS